MKRVMYLAALLMASNAFVGASAWADQQAHYYPAPNGYANASLTLQATHDIAVTDIQSSSTSVLQGEIVNIDVTVQNQGTATETFDLDLRDDTDSQEVHSVELTLDSGQSLTIGFQWDTGTASPQAHTLTAVALATGDQNPGNDSLSLSVPITVGSQQISFDPLALPKATFGQGLALAQPGINTVGAPVNTLFLGEHDASQTGALVRPAVGTQGAPHQSIFVTNADATFQPGGALQNPFRQGEVQGTLHLEGNPSSLGAHVRVGQDTHFVQSDGSFRVMSPSGSFDILLHAPGYVPVRIPGAQIDPGQMLTLPELTLPFGDANRDGRIDILDLSMAASNFGDSVVEVPPP